MKTLRKSSRVALAAGLMVASIPIVGVSGTALATSSVDQPIDAGAMPPDGAQPKVAPMYSPGPGNGYKVNPDYPHPASYFSWTIRLTTEADRVGLRSPAQGAAGDFKSATGVSMSVAAGTVPSNYQVQPNEILIHSAADFWGDKPRGSWTGAAKPEPPIANDLGVTWITAGRMVINSQAKNRDPNYIREIISHEVGHVFGLDHYESVFQGKYQVMRAQQRSGVGYKAGDRNGLLNALNRSKNPFLDSSIPGFVIAAGESLDFNGDGKTDVFTRTGSGTWNYSSGGVGSWTGLSSSAAEDQDLRFGDFNGDRKTDVFTAVWTGRTYQWKIRYGGTGNWVNVANAGIPLDQLRFGDFNGDGKTDVFSLQREGSTNRWMYSSAARSGWNKLAVASTALNDLRFGDFDGDGKTDVFVAAWTGKTYQWQYSAGGARSWKKIAAAGNPVTQLRFGDFNGDRKTDVFNAAKQGATYQWQYSSGGVTGWINIAKAGNPIDQLRFGDFNGDRKTDVFTRGKYNNKWFWQYSSAGVTGWNRMAQANEELNQLRVG